MTTESTASELRKTGISVIGEVRWGTHFCYFYETKEDLLDTLVLYFKAGLENKEFCLWVVSEPLTVEEAKHALGQAVPDLDHHLAEGGLEIHGHDEWYLHNGRSDPERVLQGWCEKLNQALARGYAGMRASGDTAWIQKEDWRVFREYEKELDGLIADQRRIILCTYPLTTSPANQIFDAARIHQVAVARRHGSWEMVETPELAKLKEDLEHRVVERTNELEKSNELLNREIKDRKSAEATLRQREEYLRVLLKNVPVGVYTCNQEGLIEYYNPKALEMWGRPPVIRDTMQRYCGSFALYHTDGTPMPFEENIMAQVIRTGILQHNQEVVIGRPDGTRVIALVNVAPLRNERGELIGAVNCILDISGRKQAEEALRESETRFRQVAENISAVFWLSNPEATLLHYVSPAYEKIWGRSCDSLYAEPSSWMDSVHPDDRERLAEDERSQSVGGRHDHTYRIARPDGSLRWIRGRAFPVRDESGKLIRVAGIAEDITERKEAEEQLEQHTYLLQTYSRRLFEVQEEERRHLARELHDEIGQALTAAKINLQSITGNGGDANVARLQETTAILDRLLGQVRQIALDLRPSMLDELGLLPALRSLLDKQGRRASVAVHFSAENVPENLDPEIQTTCFRIAQEAITNAVRHADPMQIDVDLWSEKRELRLRIRDNGVGFDAESAQVQTVGLGLIGIRERAALVGGRAKIVSSPTKGTTIEAALPLMFRPEH